MKRSGGVTVTAVVLIVVSAVVVFGAFFAALAGVILQAAGPKLPASEFARTFGASLAVLAIAIWGIVTGVGLMRLRRWAWFCVLAISAVLIADAVPGLFEARKLIRATTGVPTVGGHELIVFSYVGLAFTTLIPLALGVWWLLFFSRRGVRAQFAAGAQVDVPAFIAANPSTIEDGVAFHSPRTQLSYRRPASITVIAVLLLAGVAVLPMIFFYPPKLRIIAVFGVLLTGRKMLLVSILWAAVALVLGIGLLRLKAWARIGTILYCVASLVNGVLTVRVMGRLMDAMHKAIGISSPPLPPALQRIFEIVGMVFSFALYLVAIYFLVTRRAAFQPLPPGDSSGSFAANPATPASSGGNGASQ